MRGLALVGYRGTGKSTVGRLLSQRLGRPFRDSDREIELRAGMSIPQIFAARGEDEFRGLEQAVIADLASSPAAVVACGGGAVVRPENREALRRCGLVVWLTADPAVLAQRLSADPEQRPALTAAGAIDEIAHVLHLREPLYREVADIEIATDGRTPDEVAELVWSAWTDHEWRGDDPL